MSLDRSCRQLLSSDMATRLTEGFPGAKLYPHGRQNTAIDEIEATIIALARRQFGARHVEWRPVSTSMALAAVFFALLRPGDVALVQHDDAGGNYAYHASGPLGLAGARIEAIAPGGETFEIDVEAVRRQALACRPRVIVVGGSNVLYPYPVAALREIADEVDALVVYDAAHLGLLIAHGDFQRPLDEGAHVVVVSTHKIMGGPVGGLVLTHDGALFDRIAAVTFPGLMQTRDQNKLSALALALAETAAFGPVLANRTVKNAQALADGLRRRGFDVLGDEGKATRTHQVFLRLGEHARRTEQRCQAANILFTDCALTGDQTVGRRSGARLATHEVSRIGLGEGEMDRVADLIGKAWRGEDTGGIANAVADVLRPFSRIAYSFDTPA